ncbi:hypothetical protein FB45DRAFT_1061857 [Roridomyces roridus]|uniref:F-box domain-containing protein n=1 Tax=Roridomyces roridus TaxID=1738132 RepID=A0AAD7BJ30_9AGAR|nr:hypothetical protein FB45DRAFT_1061857 [Roridomyces roridus]
MSHLRLRNSAPTEHETNAIRQRILDMGTQKRKIDAEILVLVDRLDTHGRRSLALQEEMTVLRATISPFRRLPVEVLSRIFLASLADALSSPSYRSDDIRQPPHVLARVCSAWRTVALDTPELWCAIHLADLEKPWDGDGALFIPTFAERSRRSPLHFKMSISSNKLLGLWLSVMWPISERLESLTVCTPEGYLQALIGMTSAMFPALITLDLTVSPKPQGPSVVMDFVGEIDAFTTAPSLVTVRLSGLPGFARGNRSPLDGNRGLSMIRGNRQAVFEPRLPLSQLTELQLHCDDDLFEARQILSLSVALETFSLECCSSIGPTIDIPNCVLPKMRSLSLNVPDFARFLKPFSFPGLRELMLEGNYELTAEEVNALIQLHAKSRFELHSRAVLCLSFEAKAIVPFLLCTWSLKHLSLIDSVSADKDLFGILTYSGEPGMHMLIPDLEELTIVHTPFKYVAALKKMLQSRWWGDEGGGSTVHQWLLPYCNMPG